MFGPHNLELADCNLSMSFYFGLSVLPQSGSADFGSRNPFRPRKIGQNGDPFVKLNWDALIPVARQMSI